MKLIRAALALTAVLIVSGCIAVPVAPAYGYGQGGYYPPAPYAYAPAPYYYGPSVSFGFFGGGRGGHFRR